MPLTPTRTGPSITLLCLLVAALSAAATAAAPLQGQQPTPERMASDDRVYLLATQGEAPPFVTPPAAALPSAPAASITVQYIGPWPAQAQAAFQHAVNIWSTLVTSSVPIRAAAEWASLPSGVLGGAGPAAFYRDFPGAPVPGTWYPVALANARAGYDLDGSPDTAEIETTLNSSFPAWYFGADGNPGSGSYDFVSVVLHELGHGLGFSGSMRISGGQGSWGFVGQAPPPYRPVAYDRFAVNGSSQSLINTGLFPNPSAQLAGQLTSTNLFFDGPYATAANGGSRPKLYAPSGWQPGSSYAHLDEATYPAGTPNALMTPALSNGEANHHPGPITLGLFQDIGWPQGNTAPVIAGLPNQLLLVNTNHNNAIDLWAYASDGQTPNGQLLFTVDNSPGGAAGVSLDGNRYVDIFPTSGWTGQTSVTIRATDPGSLSATDSFSVVVASQIFRASLPFVIR